MTNKNAYEMPGFSYSLIAGEDLTGSQFCGVDIDSSGKAVLPTEGGRCIGILQNKPDEDQVATVVYDGISKCAIGITGCTAGDNLTIDDDGTLIQASGNDQTVGVALQTHASGEMGTVLIHFGIGAAGTGS